MAEDVLLVEHLPVAPDSDDEGVIALVTINRPDKLNALNQDVMSAIKAYAKEVETQGHVRCVVFTGAAPGPAPEGRRPKPNAFVAGADISEFAGKSSEEIYPIFADNGWEAIWGISKPTIAMIDGFALGGGCEVAVACDLRVASDRSSFGTPEINLGLMPGGGGTQRLARLVGLGRAMELVFTGEMIDATEAHRIGLVNHVVPAEDVMEHTLGARPHHRQQVRSDDEGGQSHDARQHGNIAERRFDRRVGRLLSAVRQRRHRHRCRGFLEP